MPTMADDWPSLKIDSDSRLLCLCPACDRNWSLGSNFQYEDSMTEEPEVFCPHCKLLGADVIHDGVCTRVNSIEYFQDRDNGRSPQVKRIEFNSFPDDFLRG